MRILSIQILKVLLVQVSVYVQRGVFLFAREIYYIIYQINIERVISLWLVKLLLVHVSVDVKSRIFLLHDTVILTNKTSRYAVLAYLNLTCRCG